MLQHLLPEAAPADAADRAIRELSSVMRCPVGLAVHTRDGRLLLASGDNTETLGRTTSACSRDLIAMTVGSARPRRAVLGARGSAGRPLGPRDERLLAAAAIPLAAWLRAVGGRLAPVHERRSRWRSFEEVVAQHEADAAALHHDLSMIVLEVSDAARSVDDPDTWVGDIRRQLRPSDLTGQLSGGDIGILLPQTSGEGASVVAARLRRLIDLEKRLAPLARAAISIATSSDGHRVTLLLAAASVQTAHASDSQ
jgi:hypothetical protein